MKRRGRIRVRRLEQATEEVKSSYAGWRRGAVVGVEARFPAVSFERLLNQCGHQLSMRNAARIRGREVRQQKTNAPDAELLLDLLGTGRFPGIGVPSLEERELRQLLVHRPKLVRMRIGVKNQLHAISQDVSRKRRLSSVKGRAKLESLNLLPWAARRR
jgi:hypothetical protein